MYITRPFRQDTHLAHQTRLTGEACTYLVGTLFAQQETQSPSAHADGAAAPSEQVCRAGC